MERRSSSSYLKGGCCHPLVAPKNAELLTAKYMDASSNYSSAETSVDARQESVVQFGGRWEMDLHASDSLDTVLTAFGVPWLLRKLLDNLPVHQEIVQGRDSLTITITTWLKTATLELVISSPLAGDAVTTHSASGPLGTDVPTHSVWVAGGEALLTTQDCSQPRQTQRLLFCTERRCALFVLRLFCVWFCHHLLLLYYLAGQINSKRGVHENTLPRHANH
eukprot:COSAG01_NODE_7617_length_3125_cov_3.377396_1_plen_221_part_00